MPIEPLLHQLREDLSPDSDRKARIRMRMEAQIGESAMLREAKKMATPTADQQSRVWASVVDAIDSRAMSTLFDRVRAVLTPDLSRATFLRQRFFLQLAPVAAPTRGAYFGKWVAAFALVLVALRISPVLFLAPTTVAQSAVILLPKGEVMVSLHGLWQPISTQTDISEAVQLKTGEGEATIILHDDGTIRLAPHTTITLHDLTDRPEPALSGPTITVVEGSVWVQGLLPTNVRGITVATMAGDATLHSGSMSFDVYEQDIPVVRVWDRHVTVRTADESKTLVSGEKATLQTETVAVRTVDAAEYEEEWVEQNLQRDAVHQREVAQMQQERRAARAGILPTSPLYTVKRVAERVDVLFTLNPEEKIQKQINQASTRLDEAAALIADGNSDATDSLAEYTAAMQIIASGSGGNNVTQFLLHQEISENTAQLAAALPEDSSYVLKKAVLEASAGLPIAMVDGRDVQAVLLVDAIDELKMALETGDVARTDESFLALQPYLNALESGEEFLRPEVRKEALSLLSDAAEVLNNQTGTGNLHGDIAEDLEPYLPRIEPRDTYVPLSDEEITVLVSRILDRVFIFSSERPRQNQLIHEVRQLDGNPDQPRILRVLYSSISDENLVRVVREAIQGIRSDISPL